MKKVLLAFIMDGNAGGIDKYILDLYNSIKSDMQVDFLTSAADSKLRLYLEENGSELFDVPSMKHPIGHYRKIKEIVQQNGYDVVYFNISTAVVFPGIAAAKHGGAKKVIIHSHSAGYDCPNALKRRAYELCHSICRSFLYKYGTDFYACSETAGKWMFPDGVTNSDRFKIIHNAIDTDRYKFSPQTRQKIRNELKIDGSFVIGHIGNFLYAKNHDFLADVFAEYLKKDGGAKLLLVGDGPLEQKIRQKVRALNIEDSVIFVGRKSNGADYLQAMDVFVFPSYFEGFGTAVAEAQCSGLPCVLSENVPKDAAFTEECRFVPLNDKKLWINAIEALKSAERRDNSELIAEKGYDLKSQDFKSII